ncbi:DUF5131 family protein [Faecalibacterium prausnitzii]|uniref:DUF5131 family protein n=1 Tax=Faecalibacterium prausnitzii TaxID=853 RepID=UPI003AAC9401
MSFLHDIWNPWHGCVKCSEGCQNCYMYFLDRMRDQNGAEIYKTKSGFSYPLQKDRTGHYKIQSGEQIRVCMTSDFFLEEADPWRAEAWDIMRQRSDVVFFLLTKRPQRVRECLPPDWGSGWDNIFFNVTCEKDVVPFRCPSPAAGTPVPAAAVCEQEKHHIAALAHDVPRLSPPRVGFFQKKSEVMQTRICSPLWIL